jgi:hypothetical protein
MTDLAFDPTWVSALTHSEKRELKRTIIDRLIAHVTNGLFTGDKRDGAVPLITLQNSWTEMFRYLARAWRRQLSRLSLLELFAVLEASAKYDADVQANRQERIAQFERDRLSLAFSELQTAKAEKPRLVHPQRAISGAARYYQNLRMKCKKAWGELSKKAFTTDDGYTVKVDRHRNRLIVQQPDGREIHSIGYSRWRQHHWPAAAQPGCIGFAS